jgi:hypothetical protein
MESTPIADALYSGWLYPKFICQVKFFTKQEIKKRDDFRAPEPYHIRSFNIKQREFVNRHSICGFGLTKYASGVLVPRMVLVTRLGDTMIFIYPVLIEDA